MLKFFALLGLLAKCSAMISGQQDEINLRRDQRVEPLDFSRVHVQDSARYSEPSARSIPLSTSRTTQSVYWSSGGRIAINRSSLYVPEKTATSAITSRSHHPHEPINNDDGSSPTRASARHSVTVDASINSDSSDSEDSDGTNSDNSRPKTPLNSFGRGKSTNSNRFDLRATSLGAVKTEKNISTKTEQRVELLSIQAEQFEQNQESIFRAIRHSQSQFQYSKRLEEHTEEFFAPAAEASTDINIQIKGTQAVEFHSDSTLLTQLQNLGSEKMNSTQFDENSTEESSDSESVFKISPKSSIETKRTDPYANLQDNVHRYPNVQENGGSSEERSPSPINPVATRSVKSSSNSLARTSSKPAQNIGKTPRTEIESILERTQAKNKNILFFNNIIKYHTNQTNQETLNDLFENFNTNTIKLDAKDKKTLMKYFSSLLTEDSAKKYIESLFEKSKIQKNSERR